MTDPDALVSRRFRAAKADDYAEPLRGMILRGEIDPPDEAVMEDRPLPPRGCCGRIMVGSGNDTYDPICELHAGHDGFCKSTAATDQHRLAVAPTYDERERG